jgi:phage baseplate assembly protein W
MKFLGAPYPIRKHPRGFLHTQEGTDQIKSDLLVLLLTTPGERVMLPTFGTNLDQFMFEQNDAQIIAAVREEISRAISAWEPRIAVTDIEVTNKADEILGSLNPTDLREDVQHILLIKIQFADMDELQTIQELKLEVPLSA